jgi:hypothetical protein
MTETVAASPVDHRPTAIASGLAVLVAAGVVLAIAGTEQALGVGLVVFGLFVVGFASHGNWDDRTGSVLLGLCGGALVAGGVAVAAVRSLSTAEAAALYPGLAGLVVLGLALVPVREDWATALATAGAGLLFVGVLNSGVTYGSGRLVLLAATVGVVTAWDAARQAISLGEQVGRRAVTGRVELRHVGATMVVGGLLVVPVEVVWRLDVTNLPLVGLVVFLGAAVAFLVVLYR